MLKHGLSKSKFNKCWYGIQQRCYNPNSQSYKRYGGLGIKCEWKSFTDFLHDMYDSYITHINIYGESNTTIERNDSTKNYSRDNCRWATYSEQNCNKSNARLILFNNTYDNLTNHAKSMNMKPSVVFNRVNRGWGIHEALTTPNTNGKHTKRL